VLVFHFHFFYHSHDFHFHGPSRGTAHSTTLAEHIATLPIRSGGVGLHDPSLSAIPACIIPLLHSIRYATFGIPHRSDPTRFYTLPTIYTQHLRHWKNTPSPNILLIRTLHTLLPSFHEATQSLLTSPPPITPPISDMVITRPLTGMSSRLYQQSIKKQWFALLPSLDVCTLGLLPSLLSPMTSIPLHSLPRSFADHRFSADNYRLLLCRKLRLPIIPPSPAMLQAPTTNHTT
jgi:hypothetical protein